MLDKVSYSLILGIDFLERHNTVIDFGSKMLHIHDGIAHAAIVQTDMKIARCYKPARIPARSQTTIPVRISNAMPGEILLLEPKLISDTAHDIVGARCLIQVNKQGRAALRIMNPTNTDIFIHKNRVLAVASIIDEEANITTLDDATNMDTEMNNDENRAQCNNVSAASSNDSLPTANAKEKIIFDLSQSDLSDSEKAQLLSFLEKHRDAFANNMAELGKTKLYHHTVETTTDNPVRTRPYKYAPKVKEELDRQVEEMLEQGIIEPSDSVWNSGVVMVPKKNKELRFAIDYRKLNALTRPISFPLPRLDDIFDAVGESQAAYFSTLDLASGFWQIPMDPATKHKAAFVTHSGVWTWSRMPFGLMNAPMSFQMLMTQVLKGLNWKYVLVYTSERSIK